jgi:alkylated DNA nucleotide flippase Atl1
MRAPGTASPRLPGAIIARLHDVAAVPWIGVFFATRSASARRPLGSSGEVRDEATPPEN